MIKIRISAIDLEELSTRTGLATKEIGKIVDIVIVPHSSQTWYQEQDLEALAETVLSLKGG